MVKVRFKNGVFEPVEKLDKMIEKLEDKEIEIEILPKLDELMGVLKHIKISSVELQHKIKDMW
jgi:hypothetical protein